jgi:methylated-DNA-[protein]-cysteine S-methyltransferase
MTPAEAPARSGLRRRELATPIGVLTLIASDRGLTRVLFENEDRADARLRTEIPVADGDDQTLAAAAGQMEEYFAGTRRRFDLPLDLGGTDFQRQAWLALADVPYGETATYGEQADRIGRPGAFRAVGAANGRNPVPVVLPCHRIIGADGSLTGFGGGLEVKQRLLDHERSQQALPGI